MTQQERSVFIRLLSKVQSECSIEVGTFKGGSLSAMAKWSKGVYSLDINNDYIQKLRPLHRNVEFIVGDCAVTLPRLIDQLNILPYSVDFILIDASHETKDVKRDIENVIRYVPTQKPCWILMHDSFKPECRLGMKLANWELSPYVHFVHLDLVPGVFNPDRSMTCGLAIALMLPEKRQGDLVVYEDCDFPFDVLEKHSIHHRSVMNRLRGVAGKIKRKIGRWI